MSRPSIHNWKKDNVGKGINDYFKEFPEGKRHFWIFVFFTMFGLVGLICTILHGLEIGIF